MSRSYNISRTEIIEEPIFMRVVELNSLKKKVNNLTRSVDNYTYKTTLEKALGEFNTLINEIYLKMDLETLRKLDDDPEELKKYVSRHVRFLNNNLINIFFIKLALNEGDKIERKDIEYLNGLLLYQLNDIYVIPVLEFRGEVDKPKRIEMYNNFVISLLEEKNTSRPDLRVAITVPAYYPRRRLDKLFSLFSNENKEPTFVVVDFAHQRPTDPSRIGIIPTINNYFLENGIEKYFIYGFNVKPHKKGQYDPIAEELLLIESGFNAVGGAYKPGDVRIIIPPQKWEHLNKLFDKGDYKYYPLSENNKREELHTWLEQYLNFEVDFGQVKSTINRYVRQYNFYQLNSEFSTLSEFIWKGDVDGIKSRVAGKEVTDVVCQSVLGRISRQKSYRRLDEFF